MVMRAETRSGFTRDEQEGTLAHSASPSASYLLWVHDHLDLALFLKPPHNIQYKYLV